MGACHVGRRTACLLYDSRCVALPSSPYECLVLQSDKDKSRFNQLPFKAAVVGASVCHWFNQAVCVATKPSVSPTTKEVLTDREVAYNIIAFFPLSSLPWRAVSSLWSGTPVCPSWSRHSRVEEKFYLNWARRERRGKQEVLV